MSGFKLGFSSALGGWKREDTQTEVNLSLGEALPPSVHTYINHLVLTT